MLNAGFAMPVNGLKVDVTIATKNSGRTLEKCLQAVSRHIPFHHVVIIDGGSTDSTLAIAKRFNAKITTEPGLLGKVRLVQASSCDTEWIAIVDSDIYVLEGWWSALSEHLKEERVGMVVGFTAPHEDDQSNTPYGKYVAFLNERFGSVAFSNALVKRQLLLQCTELLDGVHAGEDDVFARFLRRNQFTIVNVREPVCYHDTRTSGRHIDAYYRWGKSVRIKYGRGGLFKIAMALPNFGRNWLSFTKASPQRSNLQVLVHLVQLWSYSVAGFLASS